jgi:3-oxoacyl-[acyl-carrier protein] reductase
MLKSDKFELKRGAAAKAKGNDRYNRKENRHHNRDGTAGSRKSPAALSPVDFEQGQAMHFCRAAARQLSQRKKGAIVTVASIGGLSATQDRFSYVASKAAVINLTRALAVDLGKSGIRANAVAPGVIDTPMQDRNRDSFPTISEVIPLKRIGKADEVASAVLFLLSDVSSYITGATLVVDGGITAKYR